MRPGAQHGVVEEPRHQGVDAGAWAPPRTDDDRAPHREGRDRPDPAPQRDDRTDPDEHQQQHPDLGSRLGRVDPAGVREAERLAECLVKGHGPGIRRPVRGARRLAEAGPHRGDEQHRRDPGGDGETRDGAAQLGATPPGDQHPGPPCGRRHGDGHRRARMAPDGPGDGRAHPRTRPHREGAGVCSKVAMLQRDWSRATLLQSAGGRSHAHPRSGGWAAQRQHARHRGGHQRQRHGVGEDSAVVHEDRSRPVQPGHHQRRDPADEHRAAPAQPQLPRGDGPQRRGAGASGDGEQHDRLRVERGHRRTADQHPRSRRRAGAPRTGRTRSASRSAGRRGRAATAPRAPCA